MTTIMEPAPSEHPPGPRRLPRPPRISRRLWATGIAVAVVVAVIGWAGSWFDGNVLAYDGVGVRGTSYSQTSGHQEGDDFAAVETVKTDSKSERIMFHYRPNARFWYGFTLHNDGNRTVEISALPPIAIPEADVTAVLVDPQNPWKNHTQRLEAFRPFTLHADEYRYVQFEYRMTMCDSLEPASPADGSSSWRSQSVHFTVLGIARHREFQLRQEMAVASAGGWGPCPERLAQMNRRSAQQRPWWIDEHAVGVRGVTTKE
jgi:hypothetical protein